MIRESGETLRAYNRHVWAEMLFDLFEQAAGDPPLLGALLDGWILECEGVPNVGWVLRSPSRLEITLAPEHTELRAIPAGKACSLSCRLREAVIAWTRAWLDAKELLEEVGVHEGSAPDARQMAEAIGRRPALLPALLGDSVVQVRGVGEAYLLWGKRFQLCAGTQVDVHDLDGIYVLAPSLAPTIGEWARAWLRAGRAWRRLPPP